MPEFRKSKSFERSQSENLEGGKASSHPSDKRSKGFDFDIDDSWFNEYDRRDDKQKNPIKWQTFKETRKKSLSKQDVAEFEMNDDIFRSDDEYKPVKQDLFGRHLSTDDSLGNSWSGLDVSGASSNFLNKVQMSNSSSASSRHSSNSYTNHTGSICGSSVTGSRSTLRGRSFSSNSLISTRSPSRDRRLSAGSFGSMQSMPPHSPGHPRKVNSSTNVLLPGLGGQNKSPGSQTKLSGGQKSPGGGPKSPGGGQKTPGGVSKSPGGGQKSPVGGQKSPVGGQKLIGEGQKSPGGGQNKTVGGFQNSKHKKLHGSLSYTRGSSRASFSS